MDLAFYHNIKNIFSLFQVLFTIFHQSVTSSLMFCWDLPVQRCPTLFCCITASVSARHDHNNLMVSAPAIVHQIRRVACDQLYTLSQSDTSAFPDVQKPNLFLLSAILTAQLPLWSPTSVMRGINQRSLLPARP